jgi:hypothetical protein
MPAINWSFICDSAFVDDKGRASIIKTSSYIRAPSLPFRYLQQICQPLASKMV